MMESSDNHVRPKSGWLMIVAGWALGLLVITYYFSHVLEKQNNPNTLSVLSGQVGELVLERNRNGHYIAEGSINGVPVNFLLDTGATQIAVPLAVAQSAGLTEGDIQLVQTAGGTTRVRDTLVDSIAIGPLRFSKLRGVIVPAMEGEEVLLGMNVLRQLDTVEHDGLLILRPSDG
ncbi:MAG: TIGR02281 family clan AA aspartic protease [Candidatus Zeuxoniibacter abyssi]|nr:MAG: TIGR02281 family clan AA aspartic protease [Candidatus Persebacteraceae bacterium AB1(2)]